MGVMLQVYHHTREEVDHAKVRNAILQKRLDEVLCIELAAAHVYKCVYDEHLMIFVTS